MSFFSELFNIPDTLNLIFEHGDSFTRQAVVVDQKPLHEKARFYWHDIQKRAMHGPRSEFFWYEDPCSMGDMAIWQGFYLATACFKGSRGYVSVALEGVERLVTLGGNNRLLRGADSARDSGGSYEFDPSRIYHREGNYEFIDRPSESSLIGVVFGLWALYRSPMTRSFYDRASALITKLTDQLIEDDFVMRNMDGTAAKHGDLRPLTSIFQLGKRKPVATGALVALLLLAYRFTGASKYKRAYQDIADSYMDQLLHQETHFLWIHPQYQDLLAYMNYAVLCDLDKHITRRAQYHAGLWNLWMRTQDQGNSFYTYIVEGTMSNVDKDFISQAKKTLREFNTNPNLGPTGKHPGSVDISEDRLKQIGMKSRIWGWKRLKGGKRLASQPVPVWMRPPSDIIWQRSPYTVKGGEYRTYTGIDFCAAYYMGLRFGILGEKE